MRYFFKLIALASVFFFFSSSMLCASKGEKVKLGWELKFAGNYSGGSPVAVKVLSSQINGGKLIFDILIHNEDKQRYRCVWFNTSENAVHMDDELGNAYQGGKFTLKPMDNKFAPNQKKRLEVVLPEPDQEVKIVNIHFGFTVEKASGKPQTRCGDSIIGNGELNFHKLDWDMSNLR
ncbi:MAG: hypothetical protein D3914_03705 [Candidatus Electrothrix sp. LOE2]|nr:hypothetical protein [Candidatus Electrothrix sp. LOE2]